MTTTPEIIEYIKTASTQGQDIENIRESLKQNGWDDTDITEAIVQSGITMRNAETPAPGPLPTETATSEQTQPIQDTMSDASGIQSNTKKYALYIGVALIVVFVGGGGAFAYFTLQTQSSASVLRDAFLKQKSVNAIRTKTDLFFSLTGPNAPQRETSIPFQIPAQLHISENSSFDFTDAKNSIAEMQTTIEATTPKQKLALGVDIRSINNVLYIKITKIPLEITLMYPPATQFIGKWFSIDSSNIATSTQGILPSDTLQKQKMSGVYIQKAIENLLLHDHTISVSENLGDEKVGTVDSYHYQLAFNNTAKEQLFTLLLQAFKKENPSLSISQEKINSARDTFDKILAVLNQPSVYTMEVWISKDTHFITKGSLKITLTSPIVKKISDILSSSAFVPRSISQQQNQKPLLPSGDTLTITFVSTLSGQNNPVHISTPSQSTPLIPILSDTFLNPSMLQRK